MEHQHKTVKLKFLNSLAKVRKFSKLRPMVSLPTVVPCRAHFYNREFSNSEG
ncbi:hypothetical protein HMPREF9554_02460 [Treponema phagedenis F0421]|nr:hypothetical protein HMPREF9554_02460 [Treponema phagedenis F0421]